MGTGADTALKIRFGGQKKRAKQNDFSMIHSHAGATALGYVGARYAVRA
jgi:hypothetical protein